MMKRKKENKKIPKRSKGLNPETKDIIKWMGIIALVIILLLAIIYIVTRTQTQEVSPYLEKDISKNTVNNQEATNIVMNKNDKYNATTEITSENSAISGLIGEMPILIMILFGAIFITKMLNMFTDNK